MKRLWLLLILPILACGGLAEPTALPTITPLPPTLAPTPVPSFDSQPATDPAPAETKTAPAQTPPHASDYKWELIADGLNRPLEIQPANGKLFIAEKSGYIRVYENGQNLSAPLLDITNRVNDGGGEMGLLGLAFHPNYEQNGYFYVNYTGEGGHTFISRFHADGVSADPDSETLLLKIEQPHSNHNGGALAFGPDGYLYAGLGDGGGQGDPYKNGQNTAALLGKILRLDVNNGDPYSIPRDNPFNSEVWAYGLRNPWRISFDRATGDLYIGDVGQNQWEEINYLPANSAGGANFGWSIMEGNHAYDGGAQPNLLLPIAEYSHNEGGCSVTGGYVYRGAMTEWQGVYFYGDYCTGYIWGLTLSEGRWQSQIMFETGENITSFGQDESGEVYFSSDGGGVYRLVKK